MPAICEGIRVVDFGENHATTLAGMFLADNGAEVIRVEPPGGDPRRVDAAWVMLNRGKKSVILDLATPQGREDAQRLAAGADVLIEDRITGTMDSLGLGYDALRKANPQLVYASVTAFGAKGPDRDLPAREGIVQAKGGGMLSLAAWMQRNDPVFRVRPDASYAAAHLLVQAIMGALRVREAGGTGQRIETSLYQGMTCYDSGSFEPEQKRLRMIPGEPPPPTTRPHMLLTYMVARTRDGQWMQFTNNTARLYPMLLRSLGLAAMLEDERYKGAPLTFKRDEDRQEVRTRVLEKIASRTLDEWMEVFVRDGLAGDAFMTTQQFMDHPQCRANEGVVELDDPRYGKMLQIGTIVRYEKTKSSIGRPAPQPSEHAALLQQPRKPAAAATGKGSVPKHPLGGFLVLDFSGWLAAPFGCSLAADLGARVIKVEALAGDEFRGRGVAYGRTFQGKESLCIDLKHPEGQKVMHRLLKKVDAVVHNMRGDAAKRLGIDVDTVRRINPAIIYHYAGSYGSTGPGAGRAAFHPTAGAMTGGALWQNGRGNEPPPADEPLTVGEIDEWSRRIFGGNEGSPDVTAALAVGTALAMALRHKARTGEGQSLETTMLISNAYTCADDFLRYAGKPPRRDLDRELRGMSALCRLYRTAGGWLFIDVRGDSEWRALCSALGKSALAEDARFVRREGRDAHDITLISILGSAFATKKAAQWEKELRAKGIAAVEAGALGPGEFFLTDPGVKENGMIVRTEHPKLGVFYRQGPPSFFSATPSVAEGPRPLGEDNEAILTELGYSAGEIEKLRSAGVIKP
jgi:crotonobetainyl-CoA:carnitine CoA-transferase CaiB-like acyl-CoA transferase